MRTEEALKYDLGVEGLEGEDAITCFNDSFNHLKDRPDWDGYITLKEANEWYRSGNGEPLFADINKIDFDNYVSWGEKYVGETYVINYLLHIGRNIQTHIGAKVAGQGTAFNINIYGEKKLKPLLPWIK